MNLQFIIYELFSPLKKQNKFLKKILRIFKEKEDDT
jgi:hypothetical protein